MTSAFQKSSFEMPVRAEGSEQRQEQRGHNETEYHFDAIKAFEPSFIALVRQLKEAIDRGVYQVIVSDEVGGRIPSFALREVIRRRMRKAPPVFFMPAGRGWYGQISKFQQKIMESVTKLYNDGKKPLLVSEYSHTGKSLRTIVEAFDKLGVHIDVAVAISWPTKEDILSGTSGLKFLRRLRAHLRHKGHAHAVYVGLSHREAGGIPAIDKQSELLAGIEKRSWRLVPKRNRNSLYKQETIIQAREDATLLARRAIENIWGTAA